jgi:large subunit GTPase 1
LWADYFDSQGVQYAFYSAANAAAIQQARRDAETAQEAAQEAEHDSSRSEDGDASESEDNVASPSDNSQIPPPSAEGEELSGSDESDEVNSSDHFAFVAEDESEDAKDPRTRVLTVLELEDLFLKTAPDLSSMYFFPARTLCI